MRHDWRRKYVGGEPCLGRRWIPVWLLDGWHHFKIWRLFFLVLTIWSYEAEKSPEAFIYFALIYYITHKIFYEGFLKG